MACFSLFLTLVVILQAGATSAASPPQLPANEGEKLVAFSSSTLDAGQSGTLTVTLSNPLTSTISALGLSLDIYSWQGASGGGGNLSGSDTWAPSLSYGGGSASSSVYISVSALLTSTSVEESVGIAVPGGCPEGSYFIRDAANVTMANGTRYTLLSRGYFSSQLWQRATSGPDNRSTLNLTLLNVSGVLPETSIPVGSSSLVPWIWAILGASAVLAAVAAYLWSRAQRAKGVTSGASPRFRRKNAESAFGNK